MSGPSVEATFAFVDLSGFSALTEMCGDQQAASLAGRLADLASDSLKPGVTLVKTIGDAVMLGAAEPQHMVATILTLADRVANEEGFLALRAGNPPRQRGAPRQRLFRSRREYHGTHHRAGWCGTGGRDRTRPR